ncbi:MAG: extensin family protein, partial [Paracoccaceae bacterium]
VATARKGKDQGLDLASLAEDAADTAPAPKSKKKKKETASKKGAVCGVNAIKGEKIAPIKAKVKGCGLQDGVRVTSVSGVRLSQAITVDCATATALDTWVRDVLQPTYGGDVVELRIAAHYICRSRNNKKGAKISEHGKGKAVDVAGFVLSSGRLLTVAANYNKTLRRAHKAACGIFNTTLGPGSDGYHEDHLHFDTASYRSGAYCR